MCTSAHEASYPTEGASVPTAAHFCPEHNEALRATQGELGAASSEHDEGWLVPPIFFFFVGSFRLRDGLSRRFPSPQCCAARVDWAQKGARKKLQH